MRSVPFVFAIGDRGSLTLRDWAGWCAALADAGVDSLQVREKRLPDGELLALSEVARDAFDRPGRLFVNGRFDVALLAAADGVHLPATGLPAAAIRARIGTGLTLGRSTHETAEVESLAAEGAVDYVVFGPLHDTPSKRGHLEPRGLEALASACEVGLPVIAIGGLDAENVGDALRAGASGVAAMRSVADPEAAAELVAAAREQRAGARP
jgi:thiamine-phosphate pyrophosphorylase